MAFRPSITREQWIHNAHKYHAVYRLEEEIEKHLKCMKICGLPELFGTSGQQRAELVRLKKELMIECMKAGTTSRFLDEQ